MNTSGSFIQRKPRLLPLLAASALGLGAPAWASDFDTGNSFSVSDRSLALSSVNYVVSIPTASFSDFVGNSVSFRGLGVEWDGPIGSADLYWGVSLRWLYFRDIVDHGTYTVDNTTATGRLYRSMDSFPIALHLKYPVGSGGGSVLPYIGLGAGTIYGMRELNIGALSQNQYGWQFLLAPEAGILFKPSSHAKFKVIFGARYDAGFGTDSIGSVTHLSLSLGLGSTF